MLRVLLLSVWSTAVAGESHAYDFHSRRVAAFSAEVPRHLANKHSSLSVSLPASRAKKQYAYHRIRPVDLGADPSGFRDSFDALQQAVDICVNRSNVSRNGVFPGIEDNWGPIRDAGGCLVDLEGGEYRISRSIVIPEMVANMQLGHGSIVADPEQFRYGEFLIVIGVDGSCDHPQVSCNIDLNFPELFLDGANLANAMQINNVMGTTIGPGGYFLNFTEYGVQINGGHEVMMDRCWLGETNFDYKFQTHGKAPIATAIEINGNDHYILNTIVFSSKVGVAVNGAANVITGVHVWFPVNQALHFNNTMAFHIPSGGNRFTGCYADGGRVVFERGGLSDNFWTGGFECCAGQGLSGVPHGVLLRGDKIGPGLEIFNNIFQGGNVWHEPSSPGNAPSILNTRITDNSKARTTRAKQSLTQTAASTWRFNFCDQLVFPVISSVQVSLQVKEGFPRYVARPAETCTVLVETDVAVSGTMFVEVDSSSYSPSPVQGREAQHTFDVRPGLQLI